jgi:hypothetical protein
MNSQNSIKILGVGLCSSLGGYKDACSAYRAGINRFSYHDNMKVMYPGDEEPVPLTVAPAATNINGYQGVGRIIKMLASAYNDLISNISNDLPKEGLVLLMATPDPEDREYDMMFPDEVSRATRLLAYGDLITGPLFSRVNSDLNDVPMQMVFGDRVAFARIFDKATNMLAKGEAQSCLLLVADSLIGDEVLDDLLGRDMIKTSDNPVGFIPGEGAAMILLSASGQSLNGATSVSVSVAIDNTTFESTNDDRDKNDESDNNEGDMDTISPEERKSWQGDKLMTLVRSLLQSSYENQWFPQLITDINGKENRAMEFGMIQVGLKKNYPKAYLLAEQISALGFGEVGTMMGSFALSISLAAVQRGYAQHREFILLLSEDNGKRAVIKLHF